MQLKRPRCDRCHCKIYPPNKPFSNVEHLIGDAPIYCPNCGEIISNEKRRQVEKYGEKMCVVQCCLSVLCLITIINLIIFRVI